MDGKLDFIHERIDDIEENQSKNVEEDVIRGNQEIRFKIQYKKFEIWKIKEEYYFISYNIRKLELRESKQTGISRCLSGLARVDRRTKQTRSTWLKF